MEKRIASKSTEATKKTHLPESSKREIYIEKFADQLIKWDHELEEFEQKSEKKFSEFKEKISGKLADLKIRRSELRAKLNRLENVGDEAFQNIKKDIEKIWKDTVKGLRNLQNEIKKSESNPID